MCSHFKVGGLITLLMWVKQRLVNDNCIKLLTNPRTGAHNNQELGKQ